MKIKKKKIVVPPIIFPKIKIPETMISTKELEKEYKRWLRKKKFLEEWVGKSTLIIGVRGNGGIVIGSDKKVIRGGESDYEEKLEIENIGEEKPIYIGFGASGFVGVKEDFLQVFIQNLRENIRANAIRSLLDIKFIAEDLVTQFEKRYIERLQSSIILEFILAGLSNLDEGRAELYVVGSGGYGEKVKYWHAIGHGSPYVRTIAKYLFDRKFVNVLSLEEIAKRIGVCFYWISEEVDSYVGGEPSIFIMKDTEPKFEKIQIDDEKIKSLVNQLKDVLRNLKFE